MNAGKLVTFGILALAVAMGLFAWSYQRAKSDQALAYWGAENAVAIRHAPRILLWQLERANSVGDGTAAADTQSIEIEGNSWQVTRELDVSDAKGLVHLRHALVQDTSLDENVESENARWDYILRFEGEGAPVDVALALEDGLLQRLNGGHIVGLRIAGGLSTFINEQIDRAAAISASSAE